MKLTLYGWVSNIDKYNNIHLVFIKCYHGGKRSNDNSFNKLDKLKKTFPGRNPIRANNYKVAITNNTDMGLLSLSDFKNAIVKINAKFLTYDFTKNNQQYTGWKLLAQNITMANL